MNFMECGGLTAAFAATRLAIAVAMKLKICGADEQCAIQASFLRQPQPAVILKLSDEDS
jgi:hypothetical protein